MFAKMGYDGLFFSRIDYRDKDERRENKELQVLIIVFDLKLQKHHHFKACNLSQPIS